MTRRALIVAFGLLAGFMAHPSPAGEWLATPRLTVGGGYEDNPLGLASGDSNRVSSAFLRTATGLELSLFATPTVEWRAEANYDRTEFAESKVGPQDTVALRVERRWIGPADEASVSMDGGTYRDGGRSSDDETWLALDPWWRWTLADPAWRLRAGLRLQEVWFNEANTEETSTTLRLGPSWQSSQSTTWWLDGSLRFASATAEDSDHTAWGAAVGVDHWLTAKILLYAQASLDQQEYSAGESERPLLFEIGCQYRMQPWLEWFAAAVWEDPGSESGDDQNWSAQVGLRWAQGASAIH